MHKAILVALLLVCGTAQAESVPLIYEKGTYLVPVFINEKISLNFTIDSGASDVSIPADVFSTLVRTGTILRSDFVDTQEYELADGTKRISKRFRIRSLRVGDVELRNVIASVAPPEGNLLLGQSFLSRMKTWSIDNERRLLLFNELPTQNAIAGTPGQTPATHAPRSVAHAQVPGTPQEPATAAEAATLVQADNPLLKAVAIALTGNDTISVSGWPDCVFQIKNYPSVEVLTFHLNNIDPTLLRISGDLDKTVVHIAGEEVVVDDYANDPTKPLDSMAKLMTHYNQWALDLHTLDDQRVLKAWEYIYSHGCTGHKSSF